MMHPEQALKELVEGNNRFLQETSIQSAQTSLRKLKKLAVTGQLPKAIVLCCSDSRAPVEIIFDQDIGDLFVIRVAGNIIAPSLAGSIEFASSAFGTRLVLVMGHTKCGAIKATLDHLESSRKITSENINSIVQRIEPHISSIAERNDLSDEEKWEQAVEANARASVEQLSRFSPFIESRVQQGIIKIIGSVLDLSTGRVNLLA
jgi:carbonic anhydrase